jgi:hypothetical protein
VTPSHQFPLGGVMPVSRRQWGSRLRQPERLISSILLTLIVILARATFCSAEQLEETSA